MQEVVRATLPHVQGVEISEDKLAEMICSMHDASDPRGGPRLALRLPVEGLVTLLPWGQNTSADFSPHVVGVYDMSRTGIALVDAEPLATGTQFKIHFARGPQRRPIEVLCVVRHCRRHGQAFIIGAEFGASWLDTVASSLGGV